MTSRGGKRERNGTEGITRKRKRRWRQQQQHQQQQQQQQPLEKQE
jgi:hypothetical protein